MTGLRKSQRVSVLAVLAMVGATALAGCAESGGSNSAGGEGIDAGANIADYKEAFADIDPIEILTQSPAPKGSPTGANVERYLNAVTEWSDGKITFDVTYSNGIADPVEVDDALVDGRLDLGQILPIYEPSEYPATTALIEAGFVSNQSPVVGTLQSNAWPNEVAFNTKEILDEYDAHGMVPLVPVYNSGAQGLFCAESRTDVASLKGASVSSSGSAQTDEIKGLGAEPVSIAYPELFESLQRGVVDCAATTPTVGVLGGFLSESPHGIIDPDAGFALAPGSMAFSKATWDTLPLVAQQLFWDRIDVFLDSNIADKIWPNNAEAAAIVKKAGGEITRFSDDARAALNKANDALLEKIRGADALKDGDAFVDSITTSAEEWQARIEALGYKDEVEFNDFDTWFADADLDLAAYTEALVAEIFASHRPS